MRSWRRISRPTAHSAALEMAVLPTAGICTTKATSRQKRPPVEMNACHRCDEGEKRGGYR